MYGKGCGFRVFLFKAWGLGVRVSYLEVLEQIKPCKHPDSGSGFRNRKLFDPKTRTLNH